MRAYYLDANQFINYLRQQKMDNQASNDIDKGTIQGYVNHLMENYAPRTCKRKIACIKAFFNYLEFEDIISVNPFRKIRIKLNEPKELPKIIRRQEISEQLNYVYLVAHQAKTQYEKFCAARMVACYELMIGTGLRVSELSSLTTDAFDLDNQTIRIWGKGSKERIVYLSSQQMIDAILAYMQIRKRINTSLDYFFINWNGSRMRAESVRRMIRKVGNTVLNKRITPHMFRHTFATALLEKNVDISFIQALLGHSSIKTTQVYLHLSNSSIRTALMSANLREQYR